ncbi:ABC transporter permease [Sulfodiicoccus acidiphilus]|uniref:ABC transporter permease n=1 Tax=Sulfodiicoccus acidiphilus TaxID=1670455 RepID=A0A348B5Z0_9CREN|nr:ABC transporter permease [Sulfodiicoccus acidiphilus]GGU01625.1 ABC transporter permease [Sulfodiicoccus acidiphilus]
MSVSPVVRATLQQVGLVLVSAMWLVPFYSMVINGFKTNQGAISTPVLLPPAVPTLQAYTSVWPQLEGPIINSLIVSVPVTALSAFLGAMGAYFFYALTYANSRFSAAVSDFLFSVIALATFIPYQATIIPLTRFIVSLNLLNTYLGLVLAYMIFFVPTGALLMSIFIAVVPKQIIEAAKMDGASDLKIFWRVVLPLTVPAFVSTLIFVFILSWNNFFIPLVLTTTPSMKLVPITVESYTGGYGTLYNDTFAVATLASVIPLLIFIFLGRYFIRGLAALGGGGKGV